MSSIRSLDAPPSLEAANQAQIDDLVRRNRTLEHANNKLSEQLNVEVNRSKEAVLEIQRQWHEREKCLREECESFLAYYRVVQLRTVGELEMERLNVLGEQKALRKEKVLRLQRDLRVTMFHAKERELEEKVMELEEENERIISERKELASALRKKVAEIIVQMQLKDAEIVNLHSERDVIGKDVSKIREENAHLTTSLSSMNSKLERINLQLEGVQSSRSEQEGIIEDLKRKNYDLQRQLNKWQRLDNQGDAEMESLRNRKSELDIQVKELHGRLTKTTEDNTKALDKERKRVERLKEAVLEWQDTAKEHEKELKDAREELMALRMKLEKFKAQRVLVNSEPTPNLTKASSKSKRASSVTDSEAEQGQEVPKPGKPTSRRKKGTASESDTDKVQEVAPPSKTARKTRKMSPVVEEEEVNEVVTPPAQAKEKEAEVVKPKPRPKPKPKPRPVAIDVPDDEGPVPPLPRPTKTQRKRKASAGDSDAESEKPDRKVAKTAERTRATDPATKKLPTRAPSEPPASTAVDPVQKQKKRKVNLFANAASQSNQLGFEFNLGTNGLNIPMSLTPVRDVDGPVPNRAISGVMSGMGSMIRGRMGVRR